MKNQEKVKSNIREICGKDSDEDSDEDSIKIYEKWQMIKK
jgi:hypothetical protein